jgi:hypothetical protein
MSIDKATPRPWQWDGTDVYDEYRKEVVADTWGTIPSPQSIPNAKLIVRAVNSYDAMVEALEAAESLPFVQDCPITIGKIRAALALARGEK